MLGSVSLAFSIGNRAHAILNRRGWRLTASVRYEIRDRSRGAISPSLRDFKTSLFFFTSNALRHTLLHAVRPVPLPPRVRSLEYVFKRELDLSRCVSALNLPEGGTDEIIHRLSEVRAVEKVKKLGSELYRVPFPPQVEVLEHS